MTETRKEIINSNRHTPFLLPEWERQQKEYNISDVNFVQKCAIFDSPIADQYRLVV